jgi:DNA-binding response OmpR family regulator
MQPKAIVLVVEDEPQLLQVLCLAIKQLGHDFRTAADGATAVCVARKTEPNLILMDVDLPDCSGFDLCWALKQSPELASVPVVFCTGRDTPEDRRAAIQAGAADYLVKPFSLSEFAECLRRNLSSPQAQA